MNKLVLPSIKGKIGNWMFFITTMKLSDVANKERISTVSEMAELYPKNLNEVLQRELDGKRINKIADYLQNKDDRFLSSLIIAIFKGDPIFSEIKIEDNFEFADDEIEQTSTLDYARGRLGFLTLNGEEKMFALDGQHRLKGIRTAYLNSPEKTGDDDISITLVVHDTQIKERTRRLFTVLNKYAEKPKKAELIIMDEDDAAAILTRKLVMTHPFFKNEHSISKTSGFAMPPSDLYSFSTLVCLYDISKVLIDVKKIQPNSKLTTRPTERDLDDLYHKQILPFWDYILTTYPQIHEFTNGTSTDFEFNRNNINGGSLLLRPEGQITMAEIYKHFQQKSPAEFTLFKSRIPKIDFNLSNGLWKYLYWNNNRMNHKERSLKKRLLFYLLNEKVDAQNLKDDLNKFYKAFNDIFELTLEPIE